MPERRGLKHDVLEPPRVFMAAGPQEPMDKVETQVEVLIHSSDCLFLFRISTEPYFPKIGKKPYTLTDSSQMTINPNSYPILISTPYTRSMVSVWIRKQSSCVMRPFLSSIVVYRGTDFGPITAPGRKFSSI